MTINISNVQVRTKDGLAKGLGDYAGQVLLIVNVASQCGFTKQYKGLQSLQESFGPRGLKVLGFPCNDFGKQEPGSLEEIKEFCSLKYGANFELFNKVHAKGSTTEPYTTLNKTEPVGDVSWNFEKFLVGKDGNVIARFQPVIQPSDEELVAAIEVALAS